VVPQHLRSTPFPYTTLFRSRVPLQVEHGMDARLPHLYVPGTGPPPPSSRPAHLRDVLCVLGALRAPPLARRSRARQGFAGPQDRSEEHTSELQSRENLVCRL